MADVTDHLKEAGGGDKKPSDYYTPPAGSGKPPEDGNNDPGNTEPELDYIIEGEDGSGTGTGNEGAGNDGAGNEGSGSGSAFGTGNTGGAGNDGTGSAFGNQGGAGNETGNIPNIKQIVEEAVAPLVQQRKIDEGIAKKQAEIEKRKAEIMAQHDKVQQALDKARADDDVAAIARNETKMEFIERDAAEVRRDHAKLLEEQQGNSTGTGNNNDNAGAGSDDPVARAWSDPQAQANLAEWSALNPWFKQNPEEVDPEWVDENIETNRYARELIQYGIMPNTKQFMQKINANLQRRFPHRVPEGAGTSTSGTTTHTNPALGNKTGAGSSGAPAKNSSSGRIVVPANVKKQAQRMYPGNKKMQDSYVKNYAAELREERRLKREFANEIMNA